MGMIGNSLAQGLISGANIQDGTVDTPDIKDSAVTAAKIASAVVTPAKMDFSAGTANGVTYLNGSKVLTSGSALVFDGTKFGIGAASPAAKLEVGGATASAKQAIFATAPSNPNFRLEALNGDTGTTSGTLQAKFGLRYDDGSTITDSAVLRFYRGSGASDGSIGFVTNNTVQGTIDANGNLLLGLNSQAYSGKIIREDNTNAAVQSLLVRNNSSGSSSSCGLFLNSYGNSWAIEMGSTAKNSNALTFSVDALGSPAERMRLDTAGTLSLTKASSIIAVFGDTSNANDKYIRIGNSGGNFEIGTYSLAHYIYGIGSLPLSFYQNSIERIRIDTSGNVLVGTASAGAGIGWATRFAVESGTGGLYAAAFKSGAAGYGYECIDCWNVATTNNNVFINFYTEATTTFRGQITYNRGAGQISYGVSSDYRAKDIVGAFSNALDAVGQITVHLGKMKGSTFERPMFIAHELQAITPYAVMGEKDSVDEDGDPVYQQVDNLTLIPLLTAAIQEQQAIIESLTERITALETQ